MSSDICHLFRLPLELREQIWRDVLPPTIHSILVPFRKGAWRASLANEFKDPDQWHQNVIRTVTFQDWRPENLHEHIIDAPLLTVCHESRRLMLEWADEQSSKGRVLQYCGLDKERPEYLRCFDPLFDILYVSEWDLEAFLDREAMSVREREGFRSDRLQLRHGYGLALHRIAVPLDALNLIHRSRANMVRLFGGGFGHTRVRTVYILINLHLVPASFFPNLWLDQQKLWTIKMLDQGVWTWTGRGGEWDYVPGSGEMVPEIWEQISRELAKFLCWRHGWGARVCDHTMEVVPVEAVPWTSN